MPNPVVIRFTSSHFVLSSLLHVVVRQGLYFSYFFSLLLLSAFSLITTRTESGVHRHPDSDVVTAPCLMWIQALDLVLERLKQTGVDFSLINAVSGSGQQHGSVYWKKGAKEILSSLDSTKTLAQQLSNAFSILDSPVWMDSSTSVECKQLEDAVGGPDNLAKITGSRAYERFTGSQILKIRKTKPQVYDETERISLVSSFVASLFLGSYASIDVSDGSGMNLMDIQTKKWNETLINLISSDLSEKLGEIVSTGKPLGLISKYFVEKYGFNCQCTIASFTGDNPASLVGMALRDGDVAISLGTSDTMFVWIDDPKPSGIHGHILCNPLVSSSYLGLLCYKNGATTRGRIKKDFAKSSWDVFSSYLTNSSRGNNGKIGFYFDLKEIYPLLIGDYRFDELDNLLKGKTFDDDASEVRACIEGQFMRLKTHAMDLGYKIHKDTRILATGGVSTNNVILQVLADVFNADVYVQEKPNSAALGGAYLARLGESHNSLNKLYFTCFLLFLLLPYFPPHFNQHNSMTNLFLPFIDFSFLFFTLLPSFYSFFFTLILFFFSFILFLSATTDENDRIQALTLKSNEYKLAASPASDADEIYTKFQLRYRKFEQIIQQQKQ